MKSNSDLGMMPGGKTPSGIQTTMNDANRKQSTSSYREHTYKDMPSSKGGGQISGPGVKNSLRK
jgi:hypothetical protein